MGHIQMNPMGSLSEDCLSSRCYLKIVFVMLAAVETFWGLYLSAEHSVSAGVCRLSLAGGWMSPVFLPVIELSMWAQFSGSVWAFTTCSVYVSFLYGETSAPCGTFSRTIVWPIFVNPLTSSGAVLWADFNRWKCSPCLHTDLCGTPEKHLSGHSMTEFWSA